MQKKISYIDCVSLVEKKVPEKRFIHSLGVAKTMLELSKKFSLNTENAVISGIFHDAYRNSVDKDSALICFSSEWPLYKEEEENPVLIHAPLAASMIDKDLGEVEYECKVAIRYHTLGSKDMGKLGGILYVSDYIEPNRTHISDEERLLIMNLDSIEDMVLTVMNKEKIYFDKVGLKEAEISRELYSYLKQGGKL